MTRWVLALVAGAVVACSTPVSKEPPIPNTGDQRVVETNERTYCVRDLAGRHTFTVLVFFSATCPTVTAHDERVERLARAYVARDVGFYAVASEADVTLEQLKVEARRRGYSFPLVWDAGGALARHLDVRYASQAFVLTRDGSIAYAGSVDSDRRFLHADAKPFLRDALDALLSGAEPEPGDARAYGCALSL